MLTRRIIPCLDVDDGRVVKGVRFRGMRDAGDPVERARAYARAGADELVLLDISATAQRRRATTDTVGRVAAEIFIPFTVGGGLRDVEEMRAILWAGADKIAINTAAVENPDTLARAADRFGSQAVVVAIDAARDGNGWRVFVRSGREPTDRDAVSWAREAAERGAGEILLTSIDRDGTGVGFDLDLLRRVGEAAPIPIIASGGAGHPDDFRAALAAGADAVLAASMFHFRDRSIEEIKRHLAAYGIPVRRPREVA